MAYAPLFFPQVVKYGPYGHYHAHYDSSRKSDYPEGTKCCHFDMESAPMAKCRICRYVQCTLYEGASHVM